MSRYEGQNCGVLVANGNRFLLDGPEAYVANFLSVVFMLWSLSRKILLVATGGLFYT